MMKKLLLLCAILLLACSHSFSQGNLKLGANVGLPVGDAEDFADFQLGADVAYLFGAANVLELGPLVGYSRFFVEDIETGVGNIEVEDVSFLPVAASARLGLGMVFVAADLGYAISLNDGGDGGFYYRPKIGVGFIGFSIIGSYSGISNNGNSLSSVNIGIELGL